MTLSTLLLYLLLVVSSWLVVFRRRADERAPVVAYAPERPAPPAVCPVEPFTFPEPGPAAPWWASGQCVETSP